MKLGHLRRKGESNGGCVGGLAGADRDRGVALLVRAGRPVGPGSAAQRRAPGGRFPANPRQVRKQEDGLLTLEFFSDGTLSEGRLLGTGKGTYKLLPDQRIDLEIDGVFWGTNHATCRYSLSGDEFLLTPESGSGLALRYKRVP